MNVQAAGTKAGGIEAPQANGYRKAGLFILFLIGEAVIFIFGSFYFDIFPTNRNLPYNLAVAAAFLALTVWFRTDHRWNRYWRIAFAFFLASLAYPISAIFADWGQAVLEWFAADPSTSKGLAVDKVWEMLLKTVPILLLVRISGADFGSVFLKRGNLRLGLGIGALVFFFLSTATFMFAVQRFTGMEALTAAVVWGLVFSFANSFMEELWLRGIFLKRFQPLIGGGGSVWVTSIIFALMHGFAFYFEPFALAFFTVNTLALGLACGYLMMKSDSIWGSVIIHAASDFFLFVAVLANV